MIGYGTPDSRPCQRWTSVPHTSERAVRSSAEPAGRSGRANSRTSTGRRGAGITAARMRSLTAYVTLEDYCRSRTGPSRVVRVRRKPVWTATRRHVFD